MKMPRVIMASGCWDLLHRGHINLLWRAAQMGDVLLVGVVTADGIEAYKRRAPAWGDLRRLNAIRGLSFVTHAELQPTTDPSPLMERWRPDVFVHGDDWDRLIAGQETVDRLGIEFVRVPYTPGISTTELRATG